MNRFDIVNEIIQTISTVKNNKFIKKAVGNIRKFRQNMKNFRTKSMKDLSGKKQTH